MFLASPLRGLGLDAHATNRCNATHARVGCGGGRMRRRASVLRFCTIAARWNSSLAPDRPRRRMRSKPRWVFRCAKRISTRFLRSRDFRNAYPELAASQHANSRVHGSGCATANGNLVFILRRATSRASSSRSRTMRRAGMAGQHLGFSGHTRQSATAARYRIPLSAAARPVAP